MLVTRGEISRQIVMRLYFVFVKRKHDRDVFENIKRIPFYKLILVYTPPWVFVATTRWILPLHNSSLRWIASLHDSSLRWITSLHDSSLRWITSLHDSSLRSSLDRSSSLFIQLCSFF